SVRQVARGLVSYAAAVLVIALASGGVVVASGYAATWQGLSERTAKLVTGADVRVALAAEFVDPVAHAAELSLLIDAPGVSSAVRALTLDVSVGDSAELIALPADSLPKIMARVGGIDGEELARLLTDDEH